jgi:hypothetical protein
MLELGTEIAPWAGNLGVRIVRFCCHASVIVLAGCGAMVFVVANCPEDY